MPVARRIAVSLAWVAGANWLQLAISAASFALVTTRLTPAEVGAYGAAMLAVGAVQALLGGPLSESLEQRPDLSPRHVNATFWLALLCSLSLGGAIAAGAGPLMARLGAPRGGAVLAWLAASLPLQAVGGVLRALLVRNLRFREAVQIDVLAQMLGALSAIAAVLAGLRIWALVISGLVAPTAGLVLLLVAAGYRPGAPRDLGAIADLMRFNLDTLGTYVLGYLDRAVPRMVAGGLLGAQALGYLVIAGRVFDLVGQLVIAPLGAVTMASVARVQSDRTALRELLGALYGTAALFAYPAFLGAVVVTPQLAQLAGARWVPAVLTTQITLLVGLRLATAAFNIGILRGLGHTRAPLVLLGVGVLLQLGLCPAGARFGAAGVAAAMLARNCLAVPLGCWLVKRASGVSMRDQLAAGGPALASAVIMAAAAWAALQGLSGATPAAQIAIAVALGVTAYPLALLMLSANARRLGRSAWAAARTGGRRGAWSEIRGAFQPGTPAR